MRWLPTRVEQNCVCTAVAVMRVIVMLTLTCRDQKRDKERQKAKDISSVSPVYVIPRTLSYVSYPSVSTEPAKGPKCPFPTCPCTIIQALLFDSHRRAIYLDCKFVDRKDLFTKTETQLPHQHRGTLYVMD